MVTTDELWYTTAKGKSMNISEIAKLAGVSSAAVSRYFNNGYISEEKKEAIRKVVEQTGYRPSVQAQTLRTKKTKMIGVIVPKVASTSIGKIVEGILSVLNESGYQMLLAVTQNNPKKELEYLAAFNDKQVDGVIFAATILTAEHKRALKKLSVPVILVGQQYPGHCCIYHDDYHATRDLTGAVVAMGRRNPGYIGAIIQDKAVGTERFRGYEDAVSEAGIPDCAQQMVIAAFISDSGYEKMGELLEKYPDLDAVICATDTMAAGAIRYLKEHGKRVPEDILVAGHGDSEITRVMIPPIPTVHFFYEKSGEMAVEMLIEMMGQGETAVRPCPCCRRYAGAGPDGGRPHGRASAVPWTRSSAASPEPRTRRGRGPRCGVP